MNSIFLRSLLRLNQKLVCENWLYIIYRGLKIQFDFMFIIIYPHILMAMVKCISYFIRSWKLTTGSDNLSVCVYMEIIYININLAKELSWVTLFKLFLLIFLLFLAIIYMPINHSSTNIFCWIFLCWFKIAPLAFTC